MIWCDVRWYHDEEEVRVMELKGEKKPNDELDFVAAVEVTQTTSEHQATRKLEFDRSSTNADRR